MQSNKKKEVNKIMNNKRIGNKFEKDFAEYLSKKGYWVHFIETSSHVGSQPFDIIAIKRDFPELYDCKTLNNKNGLFPLSRIEENQRLAYKRVRKCKNHETFFALAIIWNNDLYFVDFDDIDFDKKSIDLKQINPYKENFYE